MRHPEQRERRDERYYEIVVPGSEMRLHERSSSRGRRWNGLSAAIFEANGGRMERRPSAEHHIAFYFGIPIRAACRCEGPVRERLQLPGDFDVIPAGASAVWEDAAPTPVLGISLSPVLIATAAREMGLRGEPPSLAPQLQVRDPKVEHLAWAIKAELESDEPLGRLYAESLGLALASQLLRRDAPLVARRCDGALSQRRLQRVLDHIRENVAQTLSLEELAALAGVSRSHFKILFKRAVGVPAHQYVIRRRVEAAIGLLASERLPLSEIALAAGFANQSHLARCMRRVAGMTPREVQRSLR
ncbi:MAG: helix-turn-helix domain-containing protein [Vulcanimicrobiaceae bacterium]